MSLPSAETVFVLIASIVGTVLVYQKEIQGFRCHAITKNASVILSTSAALLVCIYCVMYGGSLKLLMQVILYLGWDSLRRLSTPENPTGASPVSVGRYVATSCSLTPSREPGPLAATMRADVKCDATLSKASAIGNEEHKYDVKLNFDFYVQGEGPKRDNVRQFFSDTTRQGEGQTGAFGGLLHMWRGFQLAKETYAACCGGAHLQETQSGHLITDQNGDLRISRNIIDALAQTKLSQCLKTSIVLSERLAHVTKHGFTLDGSLKASDGALVDFEGKFSLHFELK